MLGTNFPARATFDDSNQLGSPSINRSEKILAIVYSGYIGLAPTEVGKMLQSITYTFGTSSPLAAQSR